MAKEIEISLRVADEGETPIEELIPAEALGEGQYRLLRSPGLVEGLAAGDEIIRSSSGSFDLIRRFGNLCIWVFTKDPGVVSKLQSRLTPLVERLGGRLDGGTNRSLIFTIPVTAGFGRVETVFRSVVDDTLGASWMFSNVYDPRDGHTPLEWWRQRELPVFRGGNPGD